MDTQNTLPELSVLENKPSLYTMQQYMHDVCKARGWDKSNYLELFLLLTEELGELAKAMRYDAGLYKEVTQTAKQDIALEMADILSYLLDLANHYNIDLAQAFREKEELNRNRQWT